MKDRSNILKLLLAFAILTGLQCGVWAQIRISGNVTGEGETLVGATVVVKGTTNGAITDIEGNYTIEVPEQSSVLLFSYVGFVQQEKTVGSQKTINVQLLADSRQIDELVVIGYGVQKKSDLTGAVSSIKGDELVKTPVLNIDQAMQGRAAGVQISSNSGAPGSNLTVRIRGVGTIGNANPLYVVDGLPVGDANFLNPADIQDIQILKDASASAIYGAAAANGVVLITTKKGVDSKMQVTYSTYYGVQNFASTYDVMNARQFTDKNIEAYVNDKAKLSGTYPYMKIAEKQNDGSYLLNYDLLDDTDWQSLITNNNAPIQNHYVSVNGGKNGVNYLMSMGYYNQQGIILSTDAEKYSFKTSIDAKVSENLKVGVNINYNTNKVNRQPENIIGNSPLGNALQMDPTVPAYSSDSLMALGYDKYRSGYVNILNPLAMIEYRNRPGERITNSLVGNVYAELSLTRDLVFRTSLGMSNANYRTTAFYPVFEMDNPTDKWLDGEYFERWENNYDLSLETQLTYHKIFNKKHDFTVLAGHSAYSYQYRIIDADKTGIINNTPEMQYLSGSLNPTGSVYGIEVREAMESVLGRAIYSYDDKYLATASLRYDGSSKFGPNNRWGSFPSFSLGWKVSNEEFMQSMQAISLLKLRAGLGIIGNNQIGNKKYSAVVTGGEGQYNYTFVEGGQETFVGGMAPPSLANKDIRWEESVQQNIGVDLNLLDNQIQLTTDFFIKNTNGMLLSSPVPGYVGLFSDPISNQGDIQNKGFELSAIYSKRTGDFNYEIGANLSHVRNKIVSMGDADAQNYAYNRNQVGFPVMAFYGYKVEGIFNNYDEIQQHALQSKRTTPGDLIYKDMNGDHKITAEDNTIIGKPWPDYSYGINASVAYKGIDCSVFLQGIQGIDIYNDMRAQLTDPSKNMTIEMLDSWTPENLGASLPKATVEDVNINRGVSSFWIEDGSYLRIKNVQMGYSLPETLLSKVKVTSCRIYVSGQNLYTWTKYSGFDPEISYSNQWYGGTALGYDAGNYPAARTILMGLEIKF
ncbi:MAG: SusC/RagA family TonB-linked outer membrane protein [Prolixibacteraceae bacterium]